MKKFQWIIWLVVIVVLLLIVFRKNIFASAGKGGIIYGMGNKIDDRVGIVKDTGEIIFLNKKEGIINSTTMQDTNKYQCTGTPAGIASSLNEMNGVGFDNGGNCVRI